jgi:hypothetical protein
MTLRPAYDEITLALGLGISVRLRPSLRAAARLAAPPDLSQRVAEFHLGTIREIILAAAIDRQEATAFLDQIGRMPLKIVADAITAPLVLFLGSFAPAEDRTDEEAPSGPPVAWHDVMKTLYRGATGWLHWTPEAAWNATPTEITEAFAGWVEKRKAMAPREPGTHEERRPSQPNAYSADQLRKIEEQGFDPAFDREGLHALKAKIAGGKR